MEGLEVDGVGGGNPLYLLASDLGLRGGTTITVWEKWGV
jgi:hypothetical protein